MTGESSTIPPIAIGLVGIGKIAHDQHLPALGASADWRLTAGVTLREQAEPVPTYRDIPEMLAAHPEIAAVSLCTPPQGRHALARQAIDLGLHVMLEKPPGASISEIGDLVAAAGAKGVALFATWHSRAAPAVEPVRRWLAGRRIDKVTVTWKEDVRRWHPGQDWVWEPGGLGVFDPGINALSILTRILPDRVFLKEATLAVPGNRAGPIAADLVMSDADGTAITAAFDWRQTGPQTWDIAVETDGGRLLMTDGGARWRTGDAAAVAPEGDEYPTLYARFAELVRTRTSDVDLSPFLLVADAFMLGRRETVEPFAW